MTWNYWTNCTPTWTEVLKKSLSLNISCFNLMEDFPAVFSRIPVATKSKAWVWGRLLSGIAGSNPFKDLDVFWRSCVRASLICLWMTTNKMQIPLANLFIPNQLYMFRAMSSPIIRSTWLYLHLLILSTSIAAGWCHGWDGTPSHPWHRPAATSVDNIRSCKYSQVLLMMGDDIARNM